MTKFENARLHAAGVCPEAGDDRGLAAWESPEAVEVNLGQASNANTNSNFDGSTTSS